MASLLPEAGMWLYIATCQLIQVTCRLSRFPGCTFYFAGFNVNSVAYRIAQVSSLHTKLNKWELMLYWTPSSHYMLLTVFFLRGMSQWKGLSCTLEPSFQTNDRAHLTGLWGKLLVYYYLETRPHLYCTIRMGKVCGTSWNWWMEVLLSFKAVNSS